MRFGSSGPLEHTPTVVKNLLIVNGLMYLLKFTHLGDLGGEPMDATFAMFGLKSQWFRPWQLVTHMFMHGNFFHLLMNMIGLFMLGTPLEYRWGSKRFLTYYMVAGLGAGVLWQAVNQWQYHQLLQMAGTMEPYAVRERASELLAVPVVGASGAVFGVLLAFGMFYPNVELMVFPIPFPVKAKFFVMIYGGIELVWTFANVPGDRVAHVAHLGGMLFGWLLIRHWRRKEPFF